MNAFESIIAQYLEDHGYWVKVSVRVDITKIDKIVIGSQSMPRPEIDLVAYNPGRKELLLVEAKSFLDSRGVKYEEVSGRVNGKLYKLFTNHEFRETVTKRLVEFYISRGLIQDGTTVKYALAAGKIHSDDELKIRKLFDGNEWVLITPKEIKESLKMMVNKGYEDNLITVTTKILIR